VTVPPSERLDLKWLTIASLVETVSLVVLLANLATVHLPEIASATGPVHGFAYLATIATAFLLPLRTRIRLLTLIPAIGGLLALSRARRTGPARRPARASAAPADPELRRSSTTRPKEGQQ
jgi:Domain of unknown function (DUF3817)